MRKTMWAVVTGAVLLPSLLSRAATPIRVMILDGESAGPYHKWQLVTPVLKKQLDETGLFQVDVVTAPSAGADLSRFKPEFTKYQLNPLDLPRTDGRGNLQKNEH